MNKLQLQFKADTGQRAIIELESKKVKEEFGGRKMRVIELELCPKEYCQGFDMVLPTPEYMKWLEEKVEQLSPKQ